MGKQRKAAGCQAGATVSLLSITSNNDTVQSIFHLGDMLAHLLLYLNTQQHKISDVTIIISII